MLESLDRNGFDSKATPELKKNPLFAIFCSVFKDLKRLTLSIAL